jgi:GNAT superfamily N-acetyltransferase
VTAPAVQTPTPADVVLTFLESLGRRSEAELYLRLFRKLPKESFAIIAPGPQVVRYGLGSLVEQIRFLADLDLFAPVVLGLFDPATAPASAERLVKRLAAAGIVPLPHSMDEPDVAERLRDELRRERIPVVHFMPEDAANGLERRIERLGELARALDTRKLVLLRRRGGLGLRGEAPLELAPGHALPSMGGWISVVNLRTDREALAASKRFPKRDGELLDCAARLIDRVAPNPLLVSVASPLNLMRELFTVKGAGTLVKRGTPVERHDGYAALDVPRLTALVQASFGRTLAPDFFEKTPLAVLLETEYRGAAILHPAEPAPYLSKFAVLPEAQGEGIGFDLWQAITRDFPSFFWRTRHDNPVLTWYLGVADGMARSESWCVFWRGLPPARIPDAIAEAVARPSDFVA